MQLPCFFCAPSSPLCPPPLTLNSPPAPLALLPSSDCWREIFSLLPPLDIARALCAQPQLGHLAPPALWRQALEVSFPTAQRLHLDRGYGGGSEEESAAAVYCCLSQGLCRLCFNSLADLKFGGDKVRPCARCALLPSSPAASHPNTPATPYILSPSSPPTAGAALFLPPCRQGLCAPAPTASGGLSWR